MSSTDHSDLRVRREHIVFQHIEAENSKDLDAMIASFHRPHYKVVPMGGTSDGEQTVRELIGGLVEAFPDFHFEPLVTHHADHAVIIEGRMTGTHQKQWAGMPARNNRIDLPVACVFDFDDDRLTNETVYFDFATLQRQLNADNPI